MGLIRFLILKFVLFLAENKNHPRHSGAGRQGGYLYVAKALKWYQKPGKTLASFIYQFTLFDER